MQVGLVDVSVPPICELQRVDDCRIGIEKHVPMEAVQIDRRHHRPLLWQLRLGLHNRRERDRLMEVESCRDVAHFGTELLAEVLHHRLHDDFGRRPGTELVRIGKQISLE